MYTSLDERLNWKVLLFVHMNEQEALMINYYAQVERVSLGLSSHLYLSHHLVQLINSCAIIREILFEYNRVFSVHVYCIIVYTRHSLKPCEW